MINSKALAVIAAAFTVLSDPWGLAHINAWGTEQKAETGTHGFLLDEGEGLQQQSRPGWNQLGDKWYWQNADGSLHYGWLTVNGRSYYTDDSGFMVTGWREINGDWYYFHQDGGMNLGTLTLDKSCYEFTSEGALASACWVPGTGGGAYDAGCCNEAAQGLLDELNEEKKERYYEADPRWEEEEDDGIHDRHAGFIMNMNLNKEAARRLNAAMEQGYTADRVPGEGTLKDYLTGIQSPYRNRTLIELYLRGCGDEGEAFDKIMAQTERRSASKSSRAYTLEYYRQIGIAHRELGGKDYFMVILMR